MFLLAVLKKRVFLFSLILGGIALAIQVLLSEFSLPQFYAFGIVLLGFAWAAYQVYRELSLEYQKVMDAATAKNAKSSSLSISLVPGNEYTYSISDPFHGRNHLISRMQHTRGMKVRFDERGICYVNDRIYYIMGRANLELNVDLHNSGDLPLDVCSLLIDNDLDLNHLRMLPEGISLNGSSAPFPLHLDGGDRLILQVRYKISINKGSSEALFAADFQALPRSITHWISVETLHAGDARQTHVAEIKTPSKPLIDLYAKQWQEYEQEEYLVLAGQHVIEGE